MSYSKSLRLLTIVLPLLLPLSPRADAALLFTFERVSDTQAILSGTGSPGLGLPTGPDVGNYLGLRLDGVLETDFGPAFGTVQPTSGDFAFGNKSAFNLNTNEGIAGWTIDNGVMIAFVPRFFGDDSSPTGADRLAVTAGVLTFLPVGTSGIIYSRYLNFDSGGERTEEQVGRWVMVEHAVPEPTSLSLLALGLASLAATRRRKR